MKRNEMALAFIEKHGNTLSNEQRQIITNLGKGVLKDNLDKQQVLMHKKKLQTIMKMFKE